MCVSVVQRGQGHATGALEFHDPEGSQAVFEFVEASRSSRPGQHDAISALGQDVGPIVVADLHEFATTAVSDRDGDQHQLPLDRPIRKALFAVDELSGFIVAVAYVRPEKLYGMTPKSVRKKMKAKGFASAVKREDIAQGAELMEAELNAHIGEVLAEIEKLGLSAAGQQALRRMHR